MAEPFHHWSRWGDEVLHRGRCRRTGDLGLMTSFQLLWPPSSQEAGTGTALAWFLLAVHTPGDPVHSKGDFGFCLGHEACIRQESPAWPSVPGSQGSPGTL